MTFFTALENLDYNLFRIVNGSHAPWADEVMWWISVKWVWIPLYILLVFLFYRKHGWRGAIGLVLIGALVVGITDSVATYALKETVQRYRPSHNVEFSHLVHIVNDYRGGTYGFVSGHAANSFAIAIFCGKITQKKFNWVFPFLIFWALVIGYSRIYLGVHYPADVVCGAILGGITGFLGYLLASKIVLKRLKK